MNGDRAVLAGAVAGDDLVDYELPGDIGVGVGDRRVAVPPGGIVIGVPLSPVTSTATVLVCPSTVSVAVHTEPAGIPV